MEYRSHKLLEILDNEIDKQRRTFELKKEIIEVENTKSM